MPDDLLTPQEVANKLRLSVRAVYDLIRSDDGGLHAHKFGHRTIRVKQSDLDEYIECNSLK